MMNKKNNISDKIPNEALERMARCLLPEIVKYFESEQGQREYEEWKSKQVA